MAAAAGKKLCLILNITYFLLLVLVSLISFMPYVFLDLLIFNQCKLVAEVPIIYYFCNSNVDAQD